MFTIGQKVLSRTNTLGKDEIASHTVTRVNGRDECWCDGAHKAEDCWLAAFLYPDTDECRAFLEDGIAMTARHKAEDAEYMTRTYQLNNALIRAGLK